MGAQVRHFRLRAGLTLTALAEQLGMTASTLSLIENGKRALRARELPTIASALHVEILDLLSQEAPDARTALELELRRLQEGPQFAALGVAPVRVSRSLPQDVLATLVRTLQELDRKAREATATPEEARRANTELRHRMRERDNHLPHIEAAAEEVVGAVGHETGALTHREVSLMAEHLGFSLMYVEDLPPLHAQHHGPRARPHLPAARLDPGWPWPAVHGTAGHGASRARPRASVLLPGVPAAEARRSIISRHAA